MQRARGRNVILPAQWHFWLPWATAPVTPWCEPLSGGAQGHTGHRNGETGNLLAVECRYQVALGSIPVAISWLLAACWSSTASLLCSWSFNALPLLDVLHLSKWIARCSDPWMSLYCLLSKKGAPCSLCQTPHWRPIPASSLSLAPGRITGETKQR